MDAKSYQISRALFWTNEIDSAENCSSRGKPHPTGFARRRGSFRPARWKASGQS